MVNDFIDKTSSSQLLQRIEDLLSKGPDLPCPRCDGKGWLVFMANVCPRCNGTGMIWSKSAGLLREEYLKLKEVAS